MSGIIIGADFIPKKSNLDLFVAGDVKELFGSELLQIIQSSDYRIFNLELPLTDELHPIDKQGPCLSWPTAAVNGYTAAGVDLVTLANNHIMDQGPQGLESTLRLLRERGIRFVGAGEDLCAASEPAVFEVYGKRIGVYACAEHEFSIAKAHTPGANPFDPLFSLDHVAELKERCDYVIVLYHGGKEYYRYPSPDLQRVCRRFVDKGADLVLCQHSHCIGCEERFGTGMIVYGQGNFLFDGADTEFWQTSLLVSVGEDLSITYIPLRKKGPVVRLAEGDEGEKILEEFRSRSLEIQRDGLLEEKYREFAAGYAESYFRAFAGRRSLVFRALNKLSGGRYGSWRLRRAYDKRARIRLENYVSCEAHRELLLQGLKIVR